MYIGGFSRYNDGRVNDLTVQEGATAAGDRMLALIRKEFPEYHPLLAIARLAHSDDFKDDPRLQLECHKTLVRYVTPELKSVEVKGEIKETRRVIVSMFDGESAPSGNTYDNGESTPRISAQEADPMWKTLDISDAELLEQAA